MHMQRLTICALLLVLMVSCGKKSKDINADEALETSDFIESFPLRELPIIFQQKDLKKIDSDSFYIKNTVVSKFLPDSIFKTEFPRTKDVRFYRKGRNPGKPTSSFRQKRRTKRIFTCFVLMPTMYSRPPCPWLKKTTTLGCRQKEASIKGLL